MCPIRGFVACALENRLLRSAALAAALSVSAPALAHDYYWVNDAGGAWDELVGGAPSWRDSADASGLPGDGDSALLVLPYAFSFCPPGGSCYTQPVIVQYRSEAPAHLALLNLESRNVLVQTTSLGVPESHLQLSSDTEIVGGATQEFTPPPSFFLPPDGPGIFPVGRHEQDAGLNTVRSQLVIGLTQGRDRDGIPSVEGEYSLGGTGQLVVGQYGFGIEKIGAAGDGRFVQSGGEHLVEGTLLLGEQPGGSGEYVLSAGILDVGSVTIVGSSGTGAFTHSGGQCETPQLILGQQFAGAGSYALSGGAELIVRSATTLGAQGWGTFEQAGGVHDAGSVVLGGPDGTGSYHLDDGVLAINESLTLADGSFRQRGGEVRLSPSGVAFATLSLGVDDYSHYALEAGRLEVLGRVQVGVNEVGDFTQTGGRHVVRTASGEGYLLVGEGGWGYYDLYGGELEADNVVVGRRGGFGLMEQRAESGTSRATIDSLEVASLASAGGYYPDYPGQDAVYALQGGTLVAEDVRIGTGGAGLFAHSGGRVTVNGRIAIGAGGRGSYRHARDFLVVNGELVLATSAASVGSYALGDASLEVNGVETLGQAGVAEFHHDAALGGYSHTVTGDLVLGAETAARGAYYLTGDEGRSRLTIDGTETIGRAGQGTFDQDGGTHTVIDALVLGEQPDSVGHYTLRSGILTVKDTPLAGGIERIGHRGEGRFEQTGGVHTVRRLEVGSDFDGDGRYSLEGGELHTTSAWIGVGRSAVGAFEQSGGAHTAGKLFVGGTGAGTASSTAGEYRLTGGDLTTGEVYLGRDGTGEFQQSGGQHTVASRLVIVGELPEGTGHYTLSGGTLEALGDEQIGGVWDGARRDWFPRWARLTQSAAGAVHRVEGSLTIGQTGRYELQQGMLQTDRVEIAGGQGRYSWDVGPSGSFSQGGGTHTVGTLAIRAAVDYWGDGGSYYLHGGVLRVERDLITEPGSSIENRGRLSMWGGTLLEIADDTLHNGGLLTITGTGARIVGHVDNQGRTEVRDGAASFAGRFDHDGELVVVDAAVEFEDLIVGPESQFQAVQGDRVVVAGDLTGASRHGDLWGAAGATLAFHGEGRHSFALAGEDRGPLATGSRGNFAWAALEIPAGVELELVDGNPDNAGTALYVGRLLIEAAMADPSALDQLPLFGQGVVYYDPLLPENAYLAGGAYPFGGGLGIARPLSIPEPAAWALALWMVAAAGLGRGLRRSSAAPMGGGE